MIYGDYVIADVFDMYAKVGDKIVISEEDLSDCGFDLTTSTTMVKSGKFNKIIAILRGEKELKVETTMPKFNLSNLAFSLGQDIITGAGEGMSRMQKVTVKSPTMEITLNKTPKTASDLVIYKNGVKLELTTDYTYLEGKVTIVEEGAVEIGDTIVIYPFIFTTSEKSQKIIIDGSSFPEGVILYLSTYAVSKKDNVEGILQFKFNDAVADGAVSFATTSERKAVENKMTFNIIEDDEGNLGEVLFIPNEAV